MRGKNRNVCHLLERGVVLRISAQCRCMADPRHMADPQGRRVADPRRMADPHQMVDFFFPGQGARAMVQGAWDSVGDWPEGAGMGSGLKVGPG